MNATLDRPGPPRPTALEIAAGISVGYDFGIPPLPSTPDTTLRSALETAVLSALQRPPCVVSFSGGRDSSIVLAIATDVARREGLPLPVPMTLRFPDDEDSDESSYQDSVVSHLGLADWERRSLTSEMDAIGPIAGPVLRRHGVSVPFNVFFHGPILQRASGGSVLTGVGGDELFSHGLYHRANLVLSGRLRPGPLDLPRIAVALLPARLRGLAVRARFPRDLKPLPWLGSQGANELMTVWRAELGLDGLSFARSVHEALWPDRDRIICLHALDLLAADEDVHCISPFSQAGVLAAAVYEQGWHDFASREHATAELTGTLLPPQLAARATKATFNTTFINTYARAFIAEWDPATLPAELAALVEVDEVRKAWAKPAGDFDARSLALLQAAWLAQCGQASDDVRSS